MNKLFEGDLAKPVPGMQLKSNEGRAWYLPHLAVYHAKKPGEIRTDMRVFWGWVFFLFFYYLGGGVSHNSQLLHGSHLTILTIRCTHMISTRTERITVQGDIEAMFTHVSVPKK